MAEKAQAAVNYLPGTDPAAIEANRVYQDALKKLNESLDLRKNRTFDPQWLAAAQGFLAPTKTGSFWESLGNVAGGLGQAQEQRIKEQQEEAQQRLGVASAGLELERLKQRDRAIGQFLGEPQTTLGMGQPGGLPSAAPAGGGALPAAPAGGAPSAGALPQAPTQAAGALPAQKPPGFEGIEGIRTMPPNPDYITGRQYVAMNRYEKGKAFPDLLKEAQKMDQDRFVTKEGGVQDLSSGMFYPFPKGEQVERQIGGSTYKVDSRTAALLDMYASTNDPKYWQIARRITQGPTPEGAEPSAGGRKSEEQLAQEKAEFESRGKKIGEKGAEKEANVKTSDQNARRIFGIAGRVENLVGESKNYFGLFQRPGIVSAIGKFVSQGIQAPGGGTINLPGLEEAVRQTLPGVKQADLDNVQRAAAELAELELLFTRMYLSGQGQVTEGERRIVQRVPGNISNSPEVLTTRLNLLKERAQFDMDIARGWDEWEKKNPGKSYIQFERSAMYRDIEDGFEKRLAAMEKRMPALPSQARPKPAAPGKNLGAARKRLDDALKQ